MISAEISKKRIISAALLKKKKKIGLRAGRRV